MLNKIKASIFTTQNDVIQLRSEIYHWLLTRGSFVLTLPGGQVLEAKDFVEYFADDAFEMAEGFKKLDINRNLDLFIAQIRANEALLEGTISFLKKACELLGNKPLLLYPFDLLSQGFAFSPDKAINIEFTQALGDLLSDEEYIYYGVLWEQEGRRFENAFVFDPDRPELFQQMLPYFITLYLAYSNSFVIRTGEMGSEKCAGIFYAEGSVPPSELIYSGFHHVGLKVGLEPESAIILDTLNLFFRGLVFPHVSAGLIQFRGRLVNDLFSNEDLQVLLESLSFGLWYDIAYDGGIPLYAVEEFYDSNLNTELLLKCDVASQNPVGLKRVPHVTTYGTNPHDKSDVFWLPYGNRGKGMVKILTGDGGKIHGEEFAKYYGEGTPYHLEYNGKDPEQNVQIARFILRHINTEKDEDFMRKRVSSYNTIEEWEYVIPGVPDHPLVVLYNWKTREIYNAYPRV